MNIWSFTGNIGKDGEQRFTPKGDGIVSFSVAVKSGYGEKASTTWANCQLWGKRGEALLGYLTKGQLVGVTGEVTLREYETMDGMKRSTLDVRVNDVTLLGGKPESSVKQDSGTIADMDDDIPFN